MKHLTLIALSAALLLSACQTAPTTASAPTTLPAGSAYIQHVPLLHTRWILSQIDQTAVVVDQPESQPFIQLSVDQHSNRLMGMGGCNRLMGSYLLDGKNVTFAVASTKMFCQDQYQIERQFLVGLSKTTSYQISGHTLHLMDQAGNVLLRLTAAE